MSAAGCPGCGRGSNFDLPFTMAFQPIVNVRSGQLFAHEALVRGVAGQGAAAVLAEITPDNRYAFDQACRTGAIETAARLGIRDTEALLSINFMPNAVFRPEACIRQTMVAATRAGLPPEPIVFEFTEHDRIEPEHLNEIVAAYGQLGFKTAIDDFGAGYSGLALLSKMRPDIVKIDMELVRDIDTLPAKRLLVRHSVNLLNDMGITIVCEGIETLAELEVLRDLGVELIQGFLIGRPGLEALNSPDVSELMACR